MSTVSSDDGKSRYSYLTCATERPAHRWVIRGSSYKDLAYQSDHMDIPPATAPCHLFVQVPTIWVSYRTK